MGDPLLRGQQLSSSSENSALHFVWAPPRPQHTPRCSELYGPGSNGIYPHVTSGVCKAGGEWGRVCQHILDPEQGMGQGTGCISAWECYLSSWAWERPRQGGRQELGPVCLFNMLKFNKGIIHRKRNPDPGAAKPSLSAASKPNKVGRGKGNAWK